MNGQFVDGRVAIEQLARWWTSATQEERFALLQRACDVRSPQKIDLRTLQIAIYLAEVEAGEVSEG